MQKVISSLGAKKSGRFVLRMPPELHAALHDAARSKGVSLNAHCVSQLAAFGLGVAGDEDVASLVVHARSVAGEALSGAILHGSWVRGEATAASDVDLLAVVDSSVTLSRALYRAWDAKPVTWRGRRVDPQFVHGGERQEVSGLWAEVALDGIVLCDRDWKLSARLARIRNMIAGGQLVRHIVHGQPYWTERA